MDGLTTRDMQQHVTILGWLLIVSHAIFLAIGVFVFFLLTGIGAVSGDGEALAILTIVTTSVAAIMGLLALPGIAAGYGLLKRRHWGRVLAIVVAVLNLVNFPSARYWACMPCGCCSSRRRRITSALRPTPPTARRARAQSAGCRAWGIEGRGDKEALT